MFESSGFLLLNGDNLFGLLWRVREVLGQSRKNVESKEGGTNRLYWAALAWTELYERGMTVKRLSAQWPPAREEEEGKGTSEKSPLREVVYVSQSDYLSSCY